MSKVRTLPLALDIGTSRVRVGLASAGPEGKVHIEAIAARDFPTEIASESDSTEELHAAVIEDALQELGTRERRAVIALGQPVAALRSVRFPVMTSIERARAARFEAQRFTTWDMEREATAVRVHPSASDEDLYFVGAVQRRTLDARARLVRSCGLKLSAADHDALALHRAFPGYDAVIDIGYLRSAVHCFGTAFSTLLLPYGGAEITRAIARELHVDEPAAERRKRILGAAGAGNDARASFVSQLSAVIERARSRAGIARIALTGNGSRLPGLPNLLQAAVHATIELPVPDALREGAYQEDVLRAAAPDWSMTAGLLTWSAA